MTAHDIYLLSPELSMAGVAMLVLLADLVLSRKSLLAPLTLAGLVGSVGALALTWGLTRFLLEITWTPAPLVNLAGLGLTALVVAVVGVTASLDVLRRKPLATLRAE